MVRTYVVCHGLDNNNNKVLAYHTSISDAKEDIIENFSVGHTDVFILTLSGACFGEGFHIRTHQLLEGKWVINTKLRR